MLVRGHDQTTRVGQEQKQTTQCCDYSCFPTTWARIDQKSLRLRWFTAAPSFLSFFLIVVPSFYVRSKEN